MDARKTAQELIKQYNSGDKQRAKNRLKMARWVFKPETYDALVEKMADGTIEKASFYIKGKIINQ